MNTNAYNKKSLWALFFGICTLALIFVSYDFRPLFTPIQNVRFYYEPTAGLFAIIALLALVLSILSLKLGFSSKRQIIIGQERGKLFAILAIIIGFVGLVFFAINAFNAAMMYLFISTGIHTAPAPRIPKY